MKCKSVCGKINGLLAREKGVVAIFNNGSSVVGLESPGSDLDFVVILNRSNNERKIVRLLRDNFKVIKNEDNPEIEIEEQFDVLGRRADFTFITREDMDKKVNDFYKSKDNFLDSQHFFKHKIVDAVAIYDEAKLLVGWKKKVEKYPKKIIKEVFDSQIVSIKEE